MESLCLAFSYEEQESWVTWAIEEYRERVIREQLETSVRFRVLPIGRMTSESEISNNVESLGKMSSSYSSAQDPQGISLNLDSVPNE